MLTEAGGFPRDTADPPTLTINAAIKTAEVIGGSATQVAYPGARLVPGLIVGATDSPFYRAQGAVAYGAGPTVPVSTRSR